MLKTKIVHSILDVYQQAWDEIAGDNVFLTYGWLKTIEQTSVIEFENRYILVQEEESLVAALATSVYDGKKHRTGLDSVLFGRLRNLLNKSGLSFLPVVVCAAFKSSGAHLLISDNLAKIKRQEVLKTLVDRFEQEAKRERLSACFQRVMDHEEELIALLKERGYVKTMDYPLVTFDIRWGSFEEYKNALKKTDKKIVKNITHEINRNKREGVVIKQIEKVGEDEDQLFQLLKKHSDRLSKTPFPFKDNFLSILKNNLGDQLRIYVSKKKGDITGISLLFIKNRNAHISMVGIDHEKAGNDFTYFVLSYYRPIQECIEAKTKKLFCGNTNYKLKIKRGGKLENSYLFYKPLNPVRNVAARLWFPVHCFWSTKKQQKL